MRREKRKYTISEAVKNRKPKVAFTGYSYLGGLKIPSIIFNKYKKGTLSEDSFVKSVMKYNADKMSGDPEKVIRSALKVTDSRVDLKDRLAYLEEQSRRITFWSESENREERSYRSSLMSAMSKMNKTKLYDDIYSKLGSAIDLEQWTYSEAEQAMVFIQGDTMYMLGFDTEFDGNYESNVLAVNSRKLPGGIHG